MGDLFREKTRGEIVKAIKAHTVLLLPLGQTEQHGRHLQVGCDCIIAEQVAQSVAEELKGDPPVLVLPTIAYGYNPKSIQNWPGSFRVRWHVMVDYIADVCTSAVEMGFEKLIIISTHGPHGDVARLAAREVFDRTGAGVVVSMPHQVVSGQYKKIRKSKPGGTSHAGEYESSLLLHFGRPVDLGGLDGRDSVKVCNEWVSGDMVNGSGRVSWSTWALQVSQTGAYGDPSCASVQTGKAAFEAIVAEYCKLVKFVREQKMPAQTFPRYPRSW